MVEKNKKTVVVSEYSILFKKMFDFLFKDKQIKMTTIANKAGIKYDRLINIKRGSSKGNELLALKLKKAFPELLKDFDINISIPITKEDLPNVKEEVESLKEEVERLKKEQFEIYKTLSQLQREILKTKD